MTTLSFPSLGFSALFTDFINQKEHIHSRFQANTRLFSDTANLTARSASAPHRALFIEAIAATMSSIQLTAEQREQLESLAAETSLTVITGQQVGYLGGALYTMLKAWTAVQSAQNLASTHKGLQFVPVFWIEDNDHDIEEIAKIGMLNQQGDALTLKSAWNLMPERVAAADAAYDGAITASLDEAIEALPNAEYSHEVAELLRTAYTPGTPVVKAFVQILQATLGASGILFVSAVELRKRGLFKQVVQKELENTGLTAETVAQASSFLAERGYHGQAQASAVNLFLHTDGKRHKINVAEGNDRFQAGEIIFSKAELLALAANEPDRFSPSVLLRPIVQDAIFPNAAYIGGPGEIAYLAQIQELYPIFGVEQSATLARHSATLMDSRTEQLCAKLKVEPSFFMRRYEDVEKSIMQEQENKPLAAALDAAKAAIEQAFANVQPHIADLDPTLAPSADRMKNQALQGVSDLEAKVRKAQKRLEETTLSKARKASSLLYPDGGLQERTLPYLYFVAKVGFEALSRQMRQIVAVGNAQEGATAHIVAVIDAETVDKDSSI